MAPTTTEPTTTTLSPEELAAKAQAAGNLNAAKAADTEIAAALQSINGDVQETQSKIDSAQARLEAALSQVETANEALAEGDQTQQQIEAQLRIQAVEGFQSGFDDEPVFFTGRGINTSIRQSQLLQQANLSTAELLEELRTLAEDRQVAQASAELAAAEAAALDAQLTEQLETLTSQQAEQLALKAAAESRIARWESELSAYAAQDAEIKSLIQDSSPTEVAVAQPREPSALGFQWPVLGPVTSAYGYRVHPVYGTRKLHSGVDVGAARGTPIVATSAGTVIFSGWQGGYGNTVIVDHGGGVTSLYAHMSVIGVSKGATVTRGDGLGQVGATGTATGNHLHFEIRVGGTATDPMPYLP